MRLLMIDNDPRYRALVRHHVTCDWADANVVAYNPLVRGALPLEFLAQGYDAVLLNEGWQVAWGDCFAWLRELVRREGFAPVVMLLEDEQGGQAARARRDGAFAVLGTAKVDHEKFVSTLRAAATRQQAVQAAWRGSPEAREQQTFGGAYVKGYRRTRKLASGSVSDLFLAESAEAGSMVALKVTRDARRADGVDQAFARFLQEYEIVRGIRHPNVVHLYDLGVTDDYAYLVMEYFARGDLRSRMRGALPPREALSYAQEVANALEAIHSAGIIHRDVKPGNVMIRDDGSLALIDFGLAKHRGLEMEITDKGLIFGTPYYMSPEQGHAQPTDARSDIYSLGVMLYEMLTGLKPYEGENPMAIIYRHAKSPIPRLPAPLVGLQTVLDRCLAKLPADRYQSAAAAAVALEDTLANVGDSGLAA